MIKYNYRNVLLFLRKINTLYLIRTKYMLKWGRIMFNEPLTIHRCFYHCFLFLTERDLPKNKAAGHRLLNWGLLWQLVALFWGSRHWLLIHGWHLAFPMMHFGIMDAYPQLLPAK